ncbi:MAG: tetratricopeptide repeat protein [Lentisphaeria bacterium]|nr:tetratricopeptide repeat protein [Lentisphaeria bacterium]
MNRFFIIILFVIFVQSFGAESNNARELSKRSDDAFLSGDLHASLRLISEAIILEQTDANYYYQRGKVLRELNQLARAKQNFQIATVFNQSHGDAWSELAICSYLLKDNTRAEKAINRALMEAPKASRLWYWRGAILFQAGDLLHAEKSLKLAVKKNPAFKDAAFQLTQVRLCMNKTKEAQKAFEHYKKLDPEVDADYYRIAATIKIQEWLHNPLLSDKLIESQDLINRGLSVSQGDHSLVLLQYLNRTLLGKQLGFDVLKDDDFNQKELYWLTLCYLLTNPDVKSDQLVLKVEKLVDFKKIVSLSKSTEWDLEHLRPILGEQLAMIYLLSLNGHLIPRDTRAEWYSLFSLEANQVISLFGLYLVQNPQVSKEQ